MKTGNWLLLVCSAVLYAVPFLLNGACWGLIFLFPVPLLLVASENQLTFKHGFFWGFVTFLLHGYGGIIVVSRMAHEWWVLGLLLGVGLVVYCALCVGVLFWAAEALLLYYSVRSPVGPIIVFTGALAGIIVWVDRYCLCIFGAVEGYPLMHPLIVL